MDVKSIVKDYSILIHKYNKKNRKKLNKIDIAFLLVISINIVLLQIFSIKEKVMAAFIACMSLIVILLCISVYYNHYDSKHRLEIAKSIKNREKEYLNIIIEVLKKHNLDISNSHHFYIVIKRLESYTANLRNPLSMAWDCIKSMFFPVLISFLPIIMQAEIYENYIVNKFLFALFMLISIIVISYSPTIYRAINNKKFIAVDIVDLLHSYILENNKIYCDCKDN